MRTALLVDVHNLYTNIAKKFPDKTLDYQATIHLLQNTGNRLDFRVAYGRQTYDQCKPFANVLTLLGFELNFGNPPYQFQMVMQAVELIHFQATDLLLIGSNHHEFWRVAAYGRRKGVAVQQFGVGVSPGNLELDERFLQ